LRRWIMSDSLLPSTATEFLRRLEEELRSVAPELERIKAELAELGERVSKIERVLAEIAGKDQVSV